MTNVSKVIPGTSNISRRQMGLAVGASYLTAMGLPGMINASTLKETNGLTLENSLQATLRAIGSAACVDAADDLARRAPSSASVAFHLRSAGITADGATLVANALASISQTERARLRSFSLSYNEIGGDGAIAFANALPQSLSELGLVGCSIADPGGEVVIQWAANAQGLGMICIESNSMSETMRDRFSQLRQTSPKLAVFI